MDLPDPKTFVDTGAVANLVDRAIGDNDELRKWLIDALVARAALPRASRKRMRDIADFVGKMVGTTITESNLRNFEGRCIGTHYAKSHKTRTEATRPSQTTNTLPPGWEKERAAASLPDETETND